MAVYVRYKDFRRVPRRCWELDLILYLVTRDDLAATIAGSIAPMTGERLSTEC
jgi:hypothetical protein